MGFNSGFKGLISTVADLLRNFGFHNIKEFLKYVNNYELCK